MNRLRSAARVGIFVLAVFGGACAPSSTSSVPASPLMASPTAIAATAASAPSVTNAPTPVVCVASGNPTSGPWIRACPAAGAVGTPVRVEGIGCNNPGAGAILVFGAGTGTTTGTYGAVELTPPAPVDASGHFTLVFDIPAQLDSLQGRGGGATTSGTYAIYSKPPVCVVMFTVP